jgi:hypothetical protein
VALACLAPWAFPVKVWHGLAAAVLSASGLDRTSALHPPLADLLANLPLLVPAWYLFQWGRTSDFKLRDALCRLDEESAMLAAHAEALLAEEDSTPGPLAG